MAVMQCIGNQCFDESIRQGTQGLFSFFTFHPFLRSRSCKARSCIVHGSKRMYKRAHAGVCAGFSAAVDTGERRSRRGGEHWRKRKEVEGVGARGIGRAREMEKG